MHFVFNFRSMEILLLSKTVELRKREECIFDVVDTLSSASTRDDAGQISSDFMFRNRTVISSLQKV